MKTLNSIIIALVLVLFFACDNTMERALTFDVTVDKNDALTFKDSVYTAPRGTTIKFNFSGAPDFISFAYDRFLPTNAVLKFSTQAAWGASVPNTLQVYVSDSFAALAGNDFAKDSSAIRNNVWEDVSALSNLPSMVNVKQNASIDINKFRSKNLCIAFRYKPTEMADWQPSWTISDLRIENNRITDNSLVSAFVAATMGFTPFDMLNKANAYRNEYVSGVWSTANSAAIQIRQTARNNPLNEDWLVSRPIEIPLGLTENQSFKGVKNNTIAVENYSHTFDRVGEYVVRFRAANVNYKNEVVVERQIKVVIVD